MKKILIRVALCLSVLTMGVGATSCDNDVINELINLIVGGKTYTYQGTYTMTLYGPTDDAPDALKQLTQTLTFSGTNVSASASTSALSGGKTLKLTLPGTDMTTDGSAVMTDVTLSGLTLTDEKISDNDSVTGSGKLTINGTEYDLNDCSVTGTITADALSITSAVLYFGSSKYAVEVTFVNGAVVS